MKTFGWLADVAEPPWQWDLRNVGWRLEEAREASWVDCRHVLICDVRQLSSAQRAELAEADRPAWRLVMVGVDDGPERARLLGAGCAEALPASVTLRELSARALRVNEMFQMLPRWRDIGPLTLDLLHRDARLGARWLYLHPREFGVLWRLSDAPGERVTRRQLLADVWRMQHDPETNSVEVHVSRMRSKLAAAGCERLVETAPEGGYRLSSQAGFMLARPQPGMDALDNYLREIGWTRETTD